MRIGSAWVSLNALHTFEAAGRHGHMARAARELGVTQSAVSHQVRSLERELGVELFNRKGRSVALTLEGRQLLETLQQALGSIAATAIQLGEDHYSGELTIASPPSFTTQFLMPRLAGFLRQYPRLSLRRIGIPIEAQSPTTDVDIAIVFDEADFPGKRVTNLVDLELFPVCAPAVAQGIEALNARSMRSQTFIHDDGGELWTRWFAAMGIEQVHPSRNIYAGTSHDAIELARNGIGFALNDRFMGATALNRGELVRPFAEATLTHGHYYLVTSQEDQMRPPAQAFERWIRQELA